MFKQIRDGWRHPKILRAMKIANAAITQGHLDVAERELQYAYGLLLDTTLARMHLINMISWWGMTAISLDERGRSDLAEHCTKMADLLQSRFDAGDYYPQEF